MAGESEKQNYSLISGVFSPDEANELLMRLLEDKIRFNQMNSWSRRERFGESGVKSEKRINELIQTKADLAALIEKAGASSQSLKITSTIEITLSPDGA